MSVASDRMRHRVDRDCTARSVLVSVIALVAGSSPAAAQLPQGGAVVAGDASFQRSGASLTVQQGSQRAVIDWRSFDVGAGNHVHFAQPSAASATLNRVNGGAGSVIAGH